jgi:hypothetical protein
VHDPAHDRGVGVDVGRRDVRGRTDDVFHPLDEAARDLEQVPLGQGTRITVDATLGTAVRHVHDRGFPGHQVCQRRGMIFIHRRMKAQATLHRPARRQQNRPHLVGQAEHIGGFMKIEMTISEHVSSAESRHGGTPCCD